MSAMKKHCEYPRKQEKPPSAIPPQPTSIKSKSGRSNCKRCWDWIIVAGNMHYAKNRSSFRTYRRAPCKISGSRVLGVGTVELKVRRAPNDDRMNTLVLQDVLHMPSARCNGLCIPKYREANPLSGVEEDGEEHFQARRGSGSGSESEREGDGEALWYGEEYHGCSRVALWGDPRGSSDLDAADAGSRVFLPSVEASAEELDTLYTRVRQRSLV